MIHILEFFPRKPIYQYQNIIAQYKVSNADVHGIRDSNGGSDRKMGVGWNVLKKVMGFQGCGCYILKR